MDIFNYLTEIIPNLFERERVPHQTKVLAMLLYFFGLALRKASKVAGVSHETLRKWWMKLGKEFFTERIEGNAVVAVDEMRVNINGYYWYVWIAFDVYRRKVIYASFSKKRKKEEASQVMKMVKVRVSGKVRFITDKGPWYWEVTEANPDLWTHKYERFGKRSLIESVIGIIRHRLRQFNRRRL